MKRQLVGLALAAGLMISGSAAATLIDRGMGLIYDDVLDITWTQNAHLSGQFFTWDGAVAWADALLFGGFDDWRLASMSVSSGVPTGSADVADVVNCATASEMDCRDNELGYMFYHNLDGMFGGNLTGNQTGVDGVDLFNIQRFYWSGTEFAPNPLDAWVFDFFGGFQGNVVKGLNLAAWAVRPGDVLAVPEPATGLLLAVGLFGLVAGAKGGRLRRW